MLVGKRKRMDASKMLYELKTFEGGPEWPERARWANYTAKPLRVWNV